MQIGDWSLQLSPHTPRAVRAHMKPYNQIVITPNRVPGSDASRADAVANARYRGPILEISDDRTRLGGAGIIHYLSWGAIETGGPGAGVVWDWDDYVGDIWSGGVASGLDLGTTYDVPATTWPATTADSSDDIPPNTFDALLFLAGVLGCEFYVATDRTFYSGGASSSSLFTTTPTVIVMRGQSGRDLDLIGLDLVEWGVSDDVWDHASTALVVDAAISSIGSASDTTIDPFAADGSQSTRTVIEVSSTIDNATDAAARATALLGENGRRRTVEVSVSNYDIGRWIKPGDYLWAFDPLNGVYDTSEATYYHGMHVTPAKLRLYSMSWPVQSGMGVYMFDDEVVSADDQIFDLTDYVVWESGSTTLEVDAPRRATLNV